jgi:DNA-binding MarR family transcriptional regulator
LVPSLKDELKKRGPFASVEQEATLAIMRTSDLLENRLARLFRRHGLTPSQYNVLRILRGEGKPMPCLDVAERMIQVAPAITRVINQLQEMKLARKTQSADDRRIFMVEPTARALRLLETLDQPVLDLHAALLSGIGQEDMRILMRILDRVRAGIGP